MLEEERGCGLFNVQLEFSVGIEAARGRSAQLFNMGVYKTWAMTNMTG